MDLNYLIERAKIVEAEIERRELADKIMDNLDYKNLSYEEIKQTVIRLENL